MSQPQTPPATPPAAPAATDAGGASVTVLNKTVRDVASPARPRRRHFLFLLSFLLCVVAPTGAAIWYLYTIAADQYVSRVSFSIRSEEFENPLDALGSLGQISTGTSSDASILNEYIRSQKLLEDISAIVDLEAIYSAPDYDPVFTLEPGKPIEDLLDYWHWMTHVAYDPGTGLIDVEVFAFDPQDANQIATAVMQASSNLVDNLSNIAREDTTRHAEFELERARDRLTEARVALGQLRDREQIIDPTIDLESRMGVLTALQQQLATAIIEYDLLASSTSEGDSRLTSAERRITAIEDRIVQERNKIGQNAGGAGDALASVVGDYEVLLADREFAEQAYIAAAASYDGALAEARRKSRYLAAHVPPTMAQSPQYPNRMGMSLGVFATAMLFWMIAMLTVYAMLDRR